MKDELFKQLESLSSRKDEIGRRSFLKVLASMGILSTIGINDTFAYSSNAKGKIVIVGGGAAGLSMAARLTRWLDDPDITLIDPSDRQFYQPGFTLIACGEYQPDEVWKEQKDCIPDKVKWIKDSVVAIDPVWRQITTANNEKISYDFFSADSGFTNKLE